MYAALSAISSQGLWILVDPQSFELRACVEWSDDNATGLSTEMAPRFNELLNQGGLRPQTVTGLWGVTGPGAFTGLRLSSAYLQGLTRALAIPLRSIPTFTLAESRFFIPLRHQKARFLDLEGAFAAGIEFLEILGDGEARLARPSSQDVVWGLRDRPLWPLAEDLRRALRKRVDAPLGLQLFYGLEPKISGQR